jgi:hypothetical protein
MRDGIAMGTREGLSPKLGLNVIGTHSEKDRIVGFSDLINGNPTVSADFKFTGPHTVVATTWKQPGSPEEKVPVTVDLQEAFDNLPR